MYTLQQIDLQIAIFSGGLFVLIAVVVKRITNGPTAILTLFMSFFFIQYFLSIVIAFGAGYWVSFVMIPEKITYSLYFALYCGSAIVGGYFAATIQEKNSNTIRSPIAQFRDRMGVTRSRKGEGSPQKHLRNAIALSSATLLLLFLEALWTEGDLSAVFESNLPRGHGQFEVRSEIDKILEVLFALTSLIGLLGALFVGRALATLSSSSMLAYAPLSIFLLLICAAPLMHSFSRASGAAFIFGAISLAVYRRRGILSFIVLSLFALTGVYLSIIGITQRSVANMGVTSFLLSAIKPDWSTLEGFIFSTESAGPLAPSANLLDALGPLSASIHFSGVYDAGPIAGLIWLLGILQPLPSLFLEFELRPGARLSKALGTFGSTGITTPALAELHYLMGYWAAFPLLAYGAFLRKVDRISRFGGRLPLIILMLTLAGIVIGGHSGIRAFARPTIIALIIYIFAGKLYKLGRLRLDLRLRTISEQLHS